MGLNVVMIGDDEIKDARENPDFALLIQYLTQNHPEAAHIDIGKCPASVAHGHRVGRYSAIHVLRGLAITSESNPARLHSLTEEDLEAEIERFYEGTDPETRFPHLVHHPDDSGFYVPVDIPEPVAFEATIAGEDDPIFVALGSSKRLLSELDALNEHLRMPGDAGTLTEQELDRAVSSHKWPTAAYAWSVLRLYARESSEKFLFVVFC